MHYRLLVTTSASSSHVARWLVHNGLYRQGFVYDSARRWSGGISDGFVIGGRWSGLLAGISDQERQRRTFIGELGEEDDAMLLTEELYDRFLAEYEGYEDENAYVDLDGEPLSREFIGEKWLVVVDYHSRNVEITSP